MRARLRLTGFEALTDVKAAAPRVRDAVAPTIARATAAATPAYARAVAATTSWLARAEARLSPARDWLTGELRKSTTLTAVTSKVGGIWMTLVDAFCATIDPYLSRYFPDIRLVAVVTPAGAVELNRTAKGDVAFLGALEAIGADERAALGATRWTAVELRLRPDQVLQRNLTLPSASREFLSAIIEHKLERLTPWRPDRVLYGYRVLNEAEAGGGLTVALSATSKDFVAAPLAALEALGLAPTAVGVEDGPLSAPIGTDLLRGAAKAGRIDSRRMVSRVALSTFAVLGIVWLTTSLAASSAEEAVQSASVRLMKARRLLKTASMGDVGERERALLDEKRPERASVVLVDKLAAAIPADTYLKELSIGADKVRLVGVTTNAPALVGELEAMGLRNVRFTAAVTREKDDKDDFEISADRPAASASEVP